jgi:hypothetical protein
VLPGNPEASIPVLVNGRPSTTSSTGDLIEITDTATETRSAGCCRIAAQHGNGDQLSVPLPISDRVSGALNVYARVADAFDEPARAAALRFAPYASVAVAVADMDAHQDARDMAGNLQVALESRAVIDQAKGILMERYDLISDAAFQALAAVSMRTNTKVRDIAEQLVRTGDFDEGTSGLV